MWSRWYRLLVWLVVGVGLLLYGCTQREKLRYSPATLTELTGAAEHDREITQRRIAKQEEVRAASGWKESGSGTVKVAKVEDCHPVSGDSLDELMTLLLQEPHFVEYLDSLREGFPYLRNVSSFLAANGKHVVLNSLPFPTVERIEMFAGGERMLSVSPTKVVDGFYHFGAATGARPIGFSIKATPAMNCSIAILFAPIYSGRFEPNRNDYMSASLSSKIPTAASSLKIVLFSVCGKDKFYRFSTPAVIYLHADIDWNR